ncbi:MAG: metallophosphoesterase [Cyclobacteriaceae bacterium]|nr:metallophosphoesterase [Cyclobacteriaceae bacterium]
MKPFLFILVLLISHGLPAQLRTVYLIGDGGKFDPVLHTHLKGELSSESELKTVVFLGDNVYSSGYKSDKKSDIKLNQQLDLISGDFQGRGFLIPGNHDWTNSRWLGYKRIINQGEKAGKDHFAPLAATPGPVAEDIQVSSSKRIKLIMIDSQWLLQSKTSKVGTTNGVDRDEEAAKFWYDLSQHLSQAARNRQMVILAAHHPLQSTGGHGRKKWYRYPMYLLTPLYLFGGYSVYGLTSQDIPHPRYLDFKKKLQASIRDYYLADHPHGAVIYAAGHQHNLQYWQEGNIHYLVSGSASKQDAHMDKVANRYRSEQVQLLYPTNEILPAGGKIKHPLQGYMKVEFYETEYQIKILQKTPENNVIQVFENTIVY